ncbi:MAG: hypothetical protein O8C59_01135 [Candidatus Methanoperedens sp.]|nr:hypothetical protein [Candidatus Methanoperedens sp.]
MKRKIRKIANSHGIIIPQSFLIGLSIWPADMISISGNNLTAPIQIIDPKVLENFSPWGGAFFDERKGILAESPPVDRLYDVRFYLKDENGSTRIRYTFQYSPGQPGYIRLPGKGDEWYQTNIGTIIRDDLDGKWIYASREWDEFMLTMLVEPGASVTVIQSPNVSDSDQKLPIKAGENISAPQPTNRIPSFTASLAVLILILLYLTIKKNLF